jgi:hypothetical protein
MKKELLSQEEQLIKYGFNLDAMGNKSLQSDPHSQSTVDHFQRTVVGEISGRMPENYRPTICFDQNDQ